MIKDFTPCLDSIVFKYDRDEEGEKFGVKGRGLKHAAVYGKIYRYQHMKDGTCKASQNRIAFELGLTRQAVNEICANLSRDGYIRAISESIGKPVEWVTTGQAGLEISAFDEITDLSSQLTGVSSQLTPPVSPAYTNKEVNKQRIKEEEEYGKIQTTLQGLGWFNPALVSLIDIEIEKWDEHVSRLKDDHKDKAITGLSAMVKASNLAASANATKFGYVEAVMRNWAKKGFGYVPGKNGNKSNIPDDPTAQAEKEAAEAKAIWEKARAKRNA